jgi:hypothetical protein
VSIHPDADLSAGYSFVLGGFKTGIKNGCRDHHVGCLLPHLSLALASDIHTCPGSKAVIEGCRSLSTELCFFRMS